MTTAYDTIIEELVRQDWDLDNLFAEVSAEKERRDRKAEIEKLKADAVRTLIAYLTATVTEREVLDYLKSDEIVKDLGESFENMVSEIGKAVKIKKLMQERWGTPPKNRKLPWEDETDAIDSEDAIREWLKNKRKG